MTQLFDLEKAFCWRVQPPKPKDKQVPGVFNMYILLGHDSWFFRTAVVKSNSPGTWGLFIRNAGERQGFHEFQRLDPWAHTAPASARRQVPLWAERKGFCLYIEKTVFGVWGSWECNL